MSRWLVSALLCTGCVPALVNQARAPNPAVPYDYDLRELDTVNSATLKWSEFFKDPNLVALVQEGLSNNQELAITSLEIDIAKNEVTARAGEFWPKVNAKVGVGLEKVGRYTSQGVGDEQASVPEHLPDFGLGLFATWEIDIWSKLRNATKAATSRYLSSVEGRKFAVTVLVGEIASTYYELLALDSQLLVLRQNIQLQQEALEVVRLRKEAARVTELAVKRFEAEVLKNQSRQFEIQQSVIEAENKLNFLVGRFPRRVERNASGFASWEPPDIHSGLPSQLLQNRPDIRQAELELKANALDVEVARAHFYPALGLRAAFGAQSFDILRLVTTPASLFYSIGADIMAPLFNRESIKAAYFAANSKQQQAVLNYERAILRGYSEASTKLGAIENFQKGTELRTAAAEKLTESVGVSSELFSAARADYVEVLLTRREALDAQIELIEAKKQQLLAVVGLYRALGGGWR